MAQWSFSLGSAATGYLTVTENWNSSTQVSLHIRVWVQKSGSWFSNSGGSWNANIGGQTGSGGFNYAGGNQTYTLWETDRTYNKDANGYVNIGCYAYINGDNSPGVGAGSTNQTYSPARVPNPPTIASATATNVSVVSATINMNVSSVGLGTSVLQRMFYKKTTDASWTQVSYDQAGTGTKSWDITGLVPATSYHFLARAINNNGDTRDLPATYPSESYKFTTLPAPNVSAATLGIIGVL